jgi:hypothetical protein
VTSEQITSHFSVAILEEMDNLARQQRHEELIETGEKLVARLRVEGTDDDTKRYLCQCLVKVGDSMAALNRFGQSLNIFESALSLAQTFMEECCDEEMNILFKIERSLNTLGMLDRIGAAEAELKSLLVSQYLQTAKDSEASKELKSDSQFAAQLLEKLWAEALERQQAEEAKNNPTWLDKIEKAFQNRYLQAFVFQAVIWCSGMLVISFLIDGAKMFMRQGLGGLNQAEHAAVSTEYKRMVKEKTSALSIHSVDGTQTIVLKPDQQAVLYTTKGPIQGRFIFYDGSLSTAASIVVASTVSPSLLFQCRGCSIASQTGEVFFIDKGEDYKLVKEINRLAKKIDGYTARCKSLPSVSSNFLIYENPLHKRAQNVSLIEGVSASNLKAKLVAGSVALLENQAFPADYDLVGYCQTGVPFAASRNRNGWKSLYPIEGISLAVDQKPVFIFCERALSPILEAIRTKFLAILAAVIGSTVLFALLARELLGKFNSRHRLRKQNS